MTAKQVVRKITKLGGWFVRQKGSHAVYAAEGGCMTVVPMHGGDMPIGTLAQIERDLAPCLGADWLRGRG